MLCLHNADDDTVDYDRNAEIFREANSFLDRNTEVFLERTSLIRDPKVQCHYPFRHMLMSENKLNFLRYFLTNNFEYFFC